ncbi:MAG: hypothetical protein QOH50_3682 [Kribbellaceae bacterium]|jgi:hypothetical protein|nr:hypothetical protein [Kribbellaceae bacterium]
MGVEDLARTVRSWMAHADPAMARRDLLLRLSAALSLAASSTPVALGDDGHAPELEPAHDLSGIWLSRYTYHSSGRAEEFDGEHHVSVRQHGDRLIGRSLSKPEESKLRLNPVGSRGDRHRDLDRADLVVRLLPRRDLPRHASAHRQPDGPGHGWPMAGLQQPVQGQHGRVATDLDRGLDEQLPLTKISGDEPQDGGYIRTITQQRDKRRLAQRR